MPRRLRSRFAKQSRKCLSSIRDPVEAKSASSLKLCDNDKDAPMNWIQRYRLRLYFRNSLWILPALAIIAALTVVSLLTRYERAVGSEIQMSPENVRAVMSVVAGSTFTLVVLVSSAVLLAVQLASAQLTPRIIA